MNFNKWWTAKHRWHRDVIAYFKANTPEQRLRLENKCFVGIKKMCKAAHKAGKNP